MNPYRQQGDIPTHPKLIRLLKSIAGIFSITVILIGAIFILAWIYKIEILQRFFPPLWIVKLNTSWGSILGGIALWLYVTQEPENTNSDRSSFSSGAKRSLRIYILMILSFIIILLGLLSLIQYSFNLSGVELSMVNPFSKQEDVIIRRWIAPNSAFNFLILGSAFLLLVRKQYRPAQFFAIVAFLIAFVALIGHIYHITVFYNVGSYTDMALFSAIAFILLSVGILFATPARGWMRVVTSQNAGGIMIRRLLPLAIALPPTLGWFVLRIYSNGASVAMAIAVFSVLNGVIFAGFIWFLAKFLNLIDRQREKKAQALDESQRRFRAIFDQTFEFIGLLAPDGTLLEVNQTALDFGGFNYEDVINKPFWDSGWWRTCDPEDETAGSALTLTRQQLQDAIARAAAGEFVRYELEVRDIYNTPATIDFSIKPIADETGRVILLIPEGRDITARKRSEEALRRLTDELEIRVRERTAELAATNDSLRQQIGDRHRAEAALAKQNQILEAIACDRPLLVILDALTQHMESLCDRTYCSILLLDPTKTTLHYAAAPSLPEGYIQETLNRVIIGPNVGCCGTAAYLGEPVIVSDIATDVRWIDNKDSALRYGLRACSSVPIRSSQGEILGTFALYYPTPKSPSENDWKAIALSIHLAGIAIESKQNQQALQESEERLRRAIVNAPFPIVIHAEDGEILQLNKVWTELSGYTHEEIPTIRDWTERAYGERQETMRLQIDWLYQLNDRVDEGEFIVITKDGTRRIWHFSSAPLGPLPDGRRSVISIATDITTLKHAQQALETRVLQQAAIAQLGQRALAGIALYTLFDEVTRLVATQLDVEYCTILEMLPDEKTLLLRSGVGWRPEVIGHEIVSVEDNSLASYTLKFNRPIVMEDLPAETRFGVSRLLQEHQVISGMSVKISARNRPFGILGAYTLEQRTFTEEDVNFLLAVANTIAAASDRQQSETERETLITQLNRERSLFEAVLQQMPAGVGIAEAPSGKLILTNAQVGQILGHPSQFVSFAEYADYQGFHMDGQPLSPEKWPLARAIEGEIVREQEIRYLRDNGTYGIIQANAAPVRDRDDKIIAAVVVVLDITDRKQAETEVRQLNETLERRVRERTHELEEVNEELKAFSYTVSHDLRAPLRAMQGFSQALLEDYGDRLDELGHEYTERIMNAAERMDTLIQNLLNYSRIARADINLQSVDLNSVIAEVQSLLENELHQTQAQFAIESPLPTVRAHRSLLVQVLTNIVSNALKFVATGVTPSVRIWAETRRGDSQMHPTWVHLWIADNGIGIAPEHQQRIFGVFERLHGIETYAGTGIGLAIVRKVIERLGGRVGVESQLDRGSRFWIELPANGDSKTPQLN